jgi:hypothetical protein
LNAKKNILIFSRDAPWTSSHTQINLRIWVPVDREILALDEAKLPKSIEHRDKRRRIALASGQGPDAIGSPHLLGYRSERPHHRRTTDQRDEIAAPRGLPFNVSEHTLAQTGCEMVFRATAKQVCHVCEGSQKQT